MTEMTKRFGVVDAHQHFWNPSDDPEAYRWLSGDYASLYRRFAPDDLKPELDAAGVSATVLVQTRSSFDESVHFLALAARTPFIAGVVAWVDLTRADAGDQIARLHDADGGDRLVGIRHQVHDEPDRNWLASSDVRRGLSAVAEHELVYDLLVRTRELPAALSVSKEMPQLNFVIDHLAKPPIATGELHPWAQLITPFGELPNVSCKLSGMVTEARLTDWSVPNLLPYAQHVLEVFGPERVAFGSDWPVCLAAAPYSRVIGAVRELVDALSPAEQAAVMGATAARVYRLK